MSLWSSHRRVFWGLMVTVFVSVVMFGVWETRGAASASSEKIVLASAAPSGADSVAPDFELSDLNGASFQLSKFKGDRPVLLYFWATWCPYCIAAKPQIAKLRENIAKDDMEILGINVGEGDSVEKLKRYQEGHPVTWPILFDQGSKVSRAYQVQGIPLFILVDKSGHIVYRSNSVPTDPKRYLR